MPRPSLSLHSSQGVPLGDNVTLRCHLPRLAAWVWLYQEEGWSYNKGKEKEQNVAEFFFVSTKREHAGRYWCQYQVSESAEVSVENDPVELVLTGEDTGDSKWLWLLPTGPCPTAVPSLMQISDIPHPAFPFTLSNMWEQGPMSPSAAGTRTMGPPSSCTRMDAQLLSSAWSQMMLAQSPSPSLG